MSTIWSEINFITRLVALITREAFAATCSFAQWISFNGLPWSSRCVITCYQSRKKRFKLSKCYGNKRTVHSFTPRTFFRHILVQSTMLNHQFKKKIYIYINAKSKIQEISRNNYLLETMICCFIQLFTAFSNSSVGLEKLSFS